MWRQSGLTRAALDVQQPGCFQENHLQVAPFISANIGRGSRKLPAAQGYAGAVAFRLRADRAQASIVEQAADDKSNAETVRLAQDHSEWKACACCSCC
jgi:hypothetical protein